MIPMKKLLLLVVGCALLLACDGKTLYSETDSDFTENRWLKSDVKFYEFHIKQPATQYELEVFFSHVYGYQFPKVPIIAEVTHPDGKIMSLEFDLILKDEKGEDLGDCAGDYCDVVQKIPTQKPLEPGSYKVRLMHDFEGEYLPNVLGVGIRVQQLMD